MSRVTQMNWSRHTHEWVMSHIWMRHVSCVSHIRHTHKWGMSHMWIKHITQTTTRRIHARMNESCHSYEWVTSHIWMGRVRLTSHIWISHVTHITTCCNHARMGWLRSVGSIKWQGSFAEYRLLYRALLQKRPIILSILLSVATPYEWCMSRIWRRHVTRTSHIWIGYVTHMNQSCHTHHNTRVMSHTHHVYESVMSHISQHSATTHIWVSRVTNMNEACHTCVTHANESCPTYHIFSTIHRNPQHVATVHLWMCHVTLATYECVMSCVMSCNIWMCHVTPATYECLTSHLNVSYMSHITFEWLLQISHMRYSYVSCLVTYECLISHLNISYVSHITFEWLTYECLIWDVLMCHAMRRMNVSYHIWISHISLMSHLNGSYETFMCVMPCDVWISHIMPAAWSL